MRRWRVALTSPLTGIALLGFFASAIVVVGGSVAGAAGPGESGSLWSAPSVPVRPTVSLLPALIAYFGGLIVLVRAWFLLRRHHLQFGLSLAAIAAVVVVWSIPMLVGPPLGSRDVYAYAAQGRMAEQGFDVYEQGPSELGADDPVLAPVDPLYWDSPVLYGPIFVFVSSVVAEVADDNVVTAVFAFRLLAVLGLLATAIAVWDLTRSLGRDPTDAVILAIANPLILFHLVSGAHNEAMMLGFLMSGVAIGRRSRFVVVGVAMCAFAAMIKLPAIMAVPFIGWPWALQARSWPRRIVRAAGCGLVAIVVVAQAGWLTGWGWGWIDALTSSRPVAAYLSVTRLIGGGFSFLTGLPADSVLSVARAAGLLVAVGVSCLLLLRRHQSWPAALGWSLLLWAVLSPTTQPWYLTWGLILVAATRAGERNRTFLVGCALALFVVLPIGPQLGLVVLDNVGILALAAGVFVLGLLTFSPSASVAPCYRSDVDAQTVTVLVPTRHEGPNIAPLLSQMAVAVADNKVLANRKIEVLFVDDSDDPTPSVIAVVADRVNSGIDRRSTNGRVKSGASNQIRVAMLHRTKDERWGGLSGAVVDGLSVASGAVVVVMDGDLQHPPARIGDLVDAIDNGNGLVAASRRIEGGSDGEGLTRSRLAFSLSISAVARMLFPIRVGRVADPLSGFFALDLRRIDLNRLYPDGFKILVELLATHPELEAVEVPFRFSGRVQGMSKASTSEGFRFVGHLLDVRVRMSRLWAGASATQRLFDQPSQATANS